LDAEVEVAAPLLARSKQLDFARKRPEQDRRDCATGQQNISPHCRCAIDTV